MRRQNPYVLSCFVAWCLGAATMLGLISCASIEETSTPGKDELILTGMMQRTEVGPGCWQLITDEGTSFEVAGITVAEIQQEGIRVQIRVRELNGIGSVCTVGKLVELLEIIRITF